MNLKKITSIVLVIIGLALFLLSTYAKQRMYEVKKSMHHTSGIIPDNPVNKQIEKAIENKISTYDMPIYLGMIGGIIFVVVGIGVLFVGKRK